MKVDADRHRPTCCSSSRKVFGDDARLLLRELQPDAFDAAVGRAVDFVQDNHSRSARGVLRGLHYQMRRMRRASWCA